MKQSIIIVDDDIEDLEMIQEAISKLADSPEIEFFFDAESLLIFLNEFFKPTQHFIHILLDINLPGMNGIALLSYLKRHIQFQKINISIITTMNSDRVKEQCLEYGADGYFIKPYNKSGWEEIIANAIYGSNIAQNNLLPDEYKFN